MVEETKKQNDFIETKSQILDLSPMPQREQDKNDSRYDNEDKPLDIDTSAISAIKSSAE
jgi:hypothetical protein